MHRKTIHALMCFFIVALCIAPWVDNTYAGPGGGTWFANSPVRRLIGNWPSGSSSIRCPDWDPQIRTTSGNTSLLPIRIRPRIRAPIITSSD